MAKIESIHLSAEDRAFYKGVSTLSKYDAALDNARKALRRVQKDIDGDNNLEALRKAQGHITEAIEAVETWKQVAEVLDE